MIGTDVKFHVIFGLVVNKYRNLRFSFGAAARCLVHKNIFLFRRRDGFIVDRLRLDIAYGQVPSARHFRVALKCK